jgi:hypothetical protein
MLKGFKRSGKGIRTSMAYVVDDLKTLKDLRAPILVAKQ